MCVPLLGGEPQLRCRGSAVCGSEMAFLCLKGSKLALNKPKSTTNNKTQNINYIAKWNWLRVLLLTCKNI